MAFDYTDKVIAITGAAGGIGSHLARDFAERGAKIVALDLNEELLNKMQGEIGNPNLHIVAGNVCDEKARG